MKFIHFFLIPIDQKYQNESAPIISYAKCTKTARNSLKQLIYSPLTESKEKKTPCTSVFMAQLFEVGTLKWKVENACQIYQSVLKTKDKYFPTPNKVMNSN